MRWSLLVLFFEEIRRLGKCWVPLRSCALGYENGGQHLLQTPRLWDSASHNLEILLIPVSMGTLTEAYRRESQYGSQFLTRAKETRIVRNSDSPGSEFKLIAVWFECTYFPESLWLETQRSEGPKRVRLLERDAL